jgi:hypothetical protein
VAAGPSRCSRYANAVSQHLPHLHPKQVSESTHASTRRVEPLRGAMHPDRGVESICTCCKAMNRPQEQVESRGRNFVEVNRIRPLATMGTRNVTWSATHLKPHTEEAQAHWPSPPAPCLCSRGSANVHSVTDCCSLVVEGEATHDKRVHLAVRSRYPTLRCGHTTDP